MQSFVLLSYSSFQEFGRDIIGDNPKNVVHHKVSARVLCILSADDALLAAQARRPNAETFRDLTSDSILGKRQSGDIGDQATAFKRAKLQTGGHPVCAGHVDIQYSSSSAHGLDRVPSVTSAMDPEDAIVLSDISRSLLREEASVGAPVSHQT